MAAPHSSRDRMLAALNCQTPSKTPCSFMLFGALHKQSVSYLDFVDRQLELGLDPYVMIPPRPPDIENDHYNLYGLPVHYHPQVVVEENIQPGSGNAAPLLHKTYQTPRGDLTAIVRQTEDWRWGDHVPFLDDYLIPRSEKFIVENADDLHAFQYLLEPPSDEIIAGFQQDSAPAIAYAREHELLLAGGWGVGADLIGWVHGLNPLVYDIYDRPGFILDLLKMIGKWNRQRMAAILAAGVDLFIKRAWYENADFFSPGVWAEMIQPELRQDVELAHQAGAKFGYIITASAMPLLEQIADTGVDVIIGIDPETYDLAATKAALKGRVCLWGGINGHLTVEHGTPERVKGEVSAALQSLGPDGFILSPVDNVREATDQAMHNVAVLIEAWETETSY